MDARETFVQHMATAKLYVDEFVGLCAAWEHHNPRRGFHPVPSNIEFNLLEDIHNLVSNKIIDNENMQPLLDELYAHEAHRSHVLEGIHAMRTQLVSALVEHWRLLQDETQLLSSGRVTMAGLVTLNIAQLDRLCAEICAPDPPTNALSFPCTMTLSLISCDELIEQPIDHLSVHGVMNALYAVYAKTDSAPYSEDFETYTGHLLRRALALLVEPGDRTVFNNADYRTHLQGGADYRYSATYLRDVTILLSNLSNYFGLAWIKPRARDPYAICQPDKASIRLARQWLLRCAGGAKDDWACDQLLKLSIYAGEYDFFNAEKRGTYARPEIVLQEHRMVDFYRLTEAAPRPSRLVVQEELLSDAEFEAKGPAAQRESMQLSLIALSAVATQLKLCSTELHGTDYIYFPSNWRERAALMEDSARFPRLLVLYGHVQLYYAGQVLMYNSALQAITAWMILLDTKLDKKLGEYSVAQMLDNFFRHGETAVMRQARLAAEAGEAVQLATGAMSVY